MVPRDDVGGGIEPDVAIEGALGADKTVDEGDERGADVVAVAARMASRSATIGAIAVCGTS